MVRTFGRGSPRHLLLDGALFLLSSYCTLFFFLGEQSFRENLGLVHFYSLAGMLFSLSGAWLSGAHRVFWRYISFADAVHLAKVQVLSFVAFSVALALFAADRALVFMVLPFQAALFAIFMMLARGVRRVLYERRNARSARGPRRRILIYGAGVVGRTLANRFDSDRSLNLDSVGFVDDDPQKLGHTICGRKVLGSGKELSQVITHYRIDEVIIAASGIAGSALANVSQTLIKHGIRPRMAGSFELSGSVGGRQEIFRDISLDDLLKRARVEIDLTSVERLCRGKRILVTGAGGTIGSEIARQLLAFAPEQLLILDNSEYGLYSIDRDLRGPSNETSFIVPLLVDLKDAGSLNATMMKYRPEIVFHAAAYKHVHLVEYNPQTAILNNVEGTRNLLRDCQAIGVETFLLISTDKAVNPSGVMGASKRLCELLVAEAARTTGRRYCAVRFGNVLGSSGSLIPLLSKQIREGGPITITDERMTRYFMRIPEAVSLVLKAASIADPGDISILRMGDPVRILDIARGVLTLHGKTEQDIPVVFVGARPGEKLHEELLLQGDELNTEHPDILVLPRAGQRALSTIQEGIGLERAVERLLTTARMRGDVVSELMAIVAPLPQSQEGIQLAAGGPPLMDISRSYVAPAAASAVVMK